LKIFAPNISENKDFKVFVFALCTLYFALCAQAQNMVVTAKLDTNKILIGDQINLVLRAQAATGTKIIFPTTIDTLRDKIEIVKQSKIDTSYSPDKQRYELSKIITITSFDSGYYAIPPFIFYADNDTVNALSTQALLLAVQTLAVDTTKAFRDIKPPLNAPLTFDEILPYLIGGFLLVAIIIVLIIYLKKRKRNVVVIAEKPKIIIPPHIEALEKLQVLKDEKLWQNGFEKEYHSRISDIVRTYIEQRFGVTALEQTTDEIMRHTLTLESITEDLRIKLKQILMLSDMVKFAKELPLPNENEISIDNAFVFVNNTIAKQKIEENYNDNLEEI